MHDKQNVVWTQPRSLFWRLLRAELIIESFFFFPPEGWRSESWPWCLISTERRGRRWAARRRGSQRPQKNPQNPEGRQVADGDQGRSERRGGQEETHSWERGTQEETPRGERAFDIWSFYLVTFVFVDATAADLLLSQGHVKDHVSRPDIPNRYLCARHLCFDWTKGL